MREIKFRAYYKPKPKGKEWEEAEVGMREVVGIKWKEWLGDEKHPFVSDLCSINIKINSHDPLASHLWCIGSEVELMQFTGLKDKNGKEIYEGDILKDLHEDHREVVFKDGGFWVRYPNGDCYMPTEEYREVIGNIYENKELLQ